MHIVIYEASEGRVVQCTATTPEQRQIFAALHVAEPAQFQDFSLPEPVRVGPGHSVA